MRNTTDDRQTDHATEKCVGQAESRALRQRFRRKYSLHVRPSLKHLRPKVFFIGPSNILVQFLGEIALCSARIHISPYRGLSDCRLTFVYPAPVKRIYMPFSRHTCGVQRATTQCAEWGSWPFKKKGNFGANCGQTVSPMLPPGKY